MFLFSLFSMMNYKYVLKVVFVFAFDVDFGVVFDCVFGLVSCSIHLFDVSRCRFCVTRPDPAPVTKRRPLQPNRTRPVSVVDFGFGSDIGLGVNFVFSYVLLLKCVF